MKRILLVDDDERFCKVAMNALQPVGFDIIRVHSAQAATVEYESASFDLVILDGHLPDMTGLEWLQEIRNKGYVPEVVFISASWRDTTRYRELIQQLDV